VQVANDIAYEQARSPSPTRRHRRSSSRPSLSTDEPTPNSEEPRRSLPHVEDVDESDDNIDAGGHVVQETSPLLEDFHPETNGGPSSHDDHSHEGSHSHGHSHGSMNMRGVLLHVLGDALGNVGVIATGLIIWLTEWKFKYYCDPVISLVITVIIFSSALPLGKSFLLALSCPYSCRVQSARRRSFSCKACLSQSRLMKSVRRSSPYGV
jgi:zinc transporter 1